ncbi:MAG: tyrosine transporter [Parachlamydiales bacterium]|nr:tyrosine transporter [Parachlamydiales bacterium]
MKGRIFGGTLLITGTTIGAGMLALPVTTGLAGFIPSIILITCVWLLTVYSAFLILEINLWFKEEANLVTMAKKVLGTTGAVFTWVVYLLLLYSLTAAYIAGGGPLIITAVQYFFPFKIPVWLGYFIFTAIFGCTICAGTKIVDWINRIFMIGLVIAFVVLITQTAPFVNMNLLEHKRWLWAIGALPIIVASFGFQMVIPSLTTYLHRDLKSLKIVIWLGTAIPFVVYLIWEYVSMGTVQIYGDYGFVQLLKKGRPVTDALAVIIATPWISKMAQCFAFCSIVTSFLGASLSLSSFLEDGFNIKNVSWGKIATFIMAFAPPLYFVICFPSGFILALQYAGVFFALLLQVMPAVIVLKGRKSAPANSYKVTGGKTALIVILIYSSFVICMQIISETNLLGKP